MLPLLGMDATLVDAETRRRRLGERLRLDWDRFDREQRRYFNRELLRARLDGPPSRVPRLPRELPDDGSA